MIPEDDRALVSVYSRPDAYYVLRSARTTAGLWLGRPESLVVLDVAASPDALGEQVLGLLSQNAGIVPHPRQDEWTEQQRAFRSPILSRARVRSWRAFVTPADLVQVARRASLTTVTPLRQDPKRSDVFTPLVTLEAELEAPPPGELGQAIVAALASV